MRWILVVLACATLACGATGPRWVGENIHVVDGYWVDTETPCLGGDCAVAVEEAVRALPAADAAQVIGAAVAHHPTSYVDTSGKTIIAAFGGLHHPSIVILDLADGRRRVVTLRCIGPISTGDGAIVEPRSCARADLSNLRVGRQPGFEP